MSEQQIEAVESPTQEHHEGGFRPLQELGRDNSKGGPHYGEFIEQVRSLMDRVRLADPGDELALEAIATLKDLNAKLDGAVTDEWSAPTWHRNDLPSRGNITLPPFLVDEAGLRDGCGPASPSGPSTSAATAPPTAATSPSASTICSA